MNPTHDFEIENVDDFERENIDSNFELTNKRTTISN